MSASWFHMDWVMTGSHNDFSEFIYILFSSSSHSYCINYLMHVCFSYLYMYGLDDGLLAFYYLPPILCIPYSCSPLTDFRYFPCFCFLCTTHLLPFNYSDLICVIYIHIFVVCISCSRHFCISCSLICVYCTVVCVFRVQD